MSSPDVATRPAPDPDPDSPAPLVDVERAEAALVEHYPRLVRLGYLVLPPSLGRNRRVLTAHAITQRALPRGRSAAGTAVLPVQRGTEGPGGDPGYGYVRLRVLRSALEAGRPVRRRAWLRRAQLPPLLPQVWGLRLFPRSGGADELALDQRLSALTGPARAAYVLRGLERVPDADIRKILEASGVEDPHAALAEADDVRTPTPAGGPPETPAAATTSTTATASSTAADSETATNSSTAAASPHSDAFVLLSSPEFDPCSLQARPTDLMRRRQHLKAALVAAAAALVCGALLGLPGEGWGPDGAAAPPYAKNPAAQAALNPAKLTKVHPQAWRISARTDFSVWPARGSLTGDRALLRRALAVWARPGGSVRVSATPGTPAGGPPGPAQLLYAGQVDGARVVLFYDGLRVARYAEPIDGTAGAALDFARVDSADMASASAVLVNRIDGNVRYLTAPWVERAAVRDLLKPSEDARPLKRAEDGVTEPLASPAGARDCRSVNSLELRDKDTTRLLADLGELTPAHLTAGRPEAPHEVSGTQARQTLARTACLLPAVRSHGVRSVNSWAYARQPLPESNGTATWVCTRADTWRGGGSRVLAQFQPPGKETGAIAAQADNSSACGHRDPKVLSGVLWKSRAGHWYVVAAGSRQLTSIATTGGVRDRADGNLLAARTKQGAKAELSGRLEDGTEVDALR